MERPANDQSQSTAENDPRSCSTCHGDGRYYYNVTGKWICTTCGHNYCVNPSGRASIRWHV